MGSVLGKGKRTLTAVLAASDGNHSSLPRDTCIQSHQPLPSSSPPATCTEGFLIPSWMLHCSKLQISTGRREDTRTHSLCSRGTWHSNTPPTRCQHPVCDPSSRSENQGDSLTTVDEEENPEKKHNVIQPSDMSKESLKQWPWTGVICHCLSGEVQAAMPIDNN